MLHHMQPDQINEQIGARVAELRRGTFSQADLAERMSIKLQKKVDPTTITRLEGGKRPITVTELFALAEILEVAVEQLMPTARSVARAWRYWYDQLQKSSDRLEACRRELGDLTVEVDTARELTGALEILRRYQTTQVADQVPYALLTIMGFGGLPRETGVSYLELVADLAVPEMVIAGAIECATAAVEAEDVGEVGLGHHEQVFMENFIHYLIDNYFKQLAEDDASS